MHRAKCTTESPLQNSDDANLTVTFVFQVSKEQKKKEKKKARQK